MRIRPNLVFAALGLLIASSLSATAAPVSISGEVTYRERMALPPNAALEVQLLDVSLADARATVHAAARLTGPGQVPLTFTLNFDDKVINPKHSYALSARITSDDRLVFINTTQYPIDPLAPAEPIQIILDFVANTGAITPAPQPPKADEAAVTQPETTSPAFFGVTWRVLDIKGNPTNDKARPTLSVAEDGRAGGKGGCNNYFAQASVEGNSISFGSPASTRMACPEPAMQQEAAFFAALAAVAAYRQEGEHLLLTDANGNPLMTLARD